MRTLALEQWKIFTANTSDERLIREIYGQSWQLRHNNPMKKMSKWSG